MHSEQLRELRDRVVLLERIVAELVGQASRHVVEVSDEVKIEERVSLNERLAR